MNKIKIGSDCEFLIFNSKDQRIPADTLLPGDTARVGTDGCPSTGELRPRPSNEPLIHIKEIQSCLKRLKTHYIKNKDYIVKAGCGGKIAPTGGHIHFSYSNNKKPKLEATTLMIKALDCMSIYLLNFEKKENASYRRNSYGHLGENRRQDWGFEYRTPSSWIVNPVIAKGVLTLAYAIVHDGINNPKILKRLTRGIVLDREKFRKCEKSYYKKYNKLLERRFKKLSLYDEYRLYINGLFALVNTGKEWGENRDVIKTWKLEGLKKKSCIFHFKTGDNYILNIKKNLKNKVGENFVPIMIYGLKEDRDHQICCNHPTMKKLIDRYIKDNKLDFTITEHRGYWNRYEGGDDYPLKLELGFRTDIRKKNMKDIMKMLESIKENYVKVFMKKDIKKENK